MILQGPGVSRPAVKIERRFTRKKEDESLSNHGSIGAVLLLIEMLSIEGWNLAESQTMSLMMNHL